MSMSLKFKLTNGDVITTATSDYATRQEAVDGIGRAWSGQASTISVHLGPEKSILINRDHIVFVEVTS